MAHQGGSGSGGNMARPSNPSGHFTPPFPMTAATIGAQPSQALFQENQYWEPPIGAMAPQLGHLSAADTLVPPAVAPQTFHFQPEVSQPHWTMPQAAVPNAMPLQQFSGTAAVQPLHGMELAARVAAMNTSPYQPFQPNNYAHGWYQAQPVPPPPQALPAPLYAAPQPGRPIGSGDPLPPPPQDAHILQRSMVAVAPPNGNSAAPPVGTNSYGAMRCARPMLPPSDRPGSWAPPVQQPGGGGQTSCAWAPQAQQHPGKQTASPASGSAQAQPARVTGKLTFEEFLLEAGIVDKQTVDKIFEDEFVEDMLGDGHGQAAEVERERDDRFVSLGGLLLALGVVSSSRAGPRTHQVRMPAQEALGAGRTGGGGRDEAAATETRERRSRRIAKRREAAAVRHHRPDKHAGPRGSQNGPGAI